MQVYVTPTPFEPGAGDLRPESLAKVSGMIPLALREALEREYETDAHFVQYHLPGSTDLPRLRKEVLPHVRAAGGNVLAHLAVVDIDNPKHGPWTESLARSAADRLVALPKPLDQWTAFYTTRGGCRLVYQLSEPMPVDLFEGLHRGLVRDLKLAGLEPDMNCSDWTRLFRLPKVVRDGSKTSEDEYFDLLVRDVRFDARSVRVDHAHIVSDGPVTFTEPDLGELPEDIPTRALLVDPETGKPTAWWHEAKKRLRGRQCYAALFEQARLAEPGGRDSTIHSMVGESISILYYLPGTSSLLIYALYLDPILALQTDEKGDFRARCWRAINRYWSREEAKAQQALRIDTEKARVGETLLDKILRGMREWCEAPEIHAEDPIAHHYISNRLLACTASHVYIMGPSGYYDTVGVPVKLVCARIRQMKMDTLIPLQELDSNGKPRQVNAQSLVDRYGMVVRDIEGVSGSPGMPGGSIRQIDTESATLELPLFRRREDLDPQYDKDVDGWLHSLVKEDDFELLVNWIGHALAFEDGPICALSLAGPPGIGKKMLVQGLAECVSSQVAGDGKELFDEFQGMICRTPIFSINEGFPKKTFAIGKDPADKFRSMISGDPEPVNMKYMPLMMIRNPLRLIFTANNLDVVSSLTAGRDLSPDDRAALAQRLLHLDCPEGAATWLRMRGGLAFTSRTGRRWCRKDNGERSDYVVAKHFMHLWATRKPVAAGNRFLVEGCLSHALLRILAIRSGAAPLVIETIIRMVEKSRTAGTYQVDGIAVSESEILVTVAAIVEAFRSDLGRQTKREIEANQVASVLRGIMRNEPRMRTPEVKGAGKKRYAKYYEIDPHTLQEEAEEYGYSSTILTSIAMKSPRRLAEADRFIRQVEKHLAAPKTEE